MLVFNQDTLHRSVNNENKMTIQLRYEELTRSFSKKTVNQIIDPEVKKFWIDKYSSNEK